MLLATLLATLAIAAPAFGASYYVDSVSGSDSRSGTSESQAWKTLRKASGAPLAAGDRLLLKRGSVWTDKLDVSRSGTATAPISVSAYGTGLLPLIHGDCISLRGSYVHVTDVHLTKCSWSGIDIYGHEDVVKNSRISKNVAGVFVRPGATDNMISKNEITDNNRMSVLTASPTDDDSGAFGVLLQGDRTVVVQNEISGSEAFSYDYGRDGSAIEVFGGQGNYIHHNVAVNNHSFTELGGSRSADNTYGYNVVHSSSAASDFLVTRGANDSRGPVYRTSLYNNTVLLTDPASQGFICHGGCSSDILKMRNNIVQAVLKVGYADGKFDEDYDLFYGGQLQFTKGAHSLVGSPAFASATNWDLHLRSASAAVDRGVNLGYVRDADGRVVPQDGNADALPSPDLGAYELPGAAPAPEIAAAGDISPTSATAGNLKTSDLLVLSPPTRVLTLGDNQYPDGALTDYTAYYNATWGRLRPITSPAPGNHDQHLSLSAQGYWTYFGAAAGTQGKGFYSYDLGAWHLIALNSGCASSTSAPNSPPCAVGSEQEKWLRADLAAHPNKCALAYWHHSRFSSSSTSGADPDVQPFVQAAYDYGVDVILNGHAHVYERFAPQDPSGRADATRGFRQFTVGTGGNSLYSFGTTAANSEVRYNGGFGVLRLTLRPDRYDWRFQSEAGKTFSDSGSTLCH